MAVNVGPELPDNFLEKQEMDESVNGAPVINPQTATNGADHLHRHPPRQDNLLENGHAAVNGSSHAHFSGSREADSGKDASKAPESVPPPIAIVGIGLKLPGGVTTTEEYWDLLVSKRSTQSQVPANRFSRCGFQSVSELNSTNKHTNGHYIDCEFETWDASFFSMSKAEAEKLDPQQRLVLQVIWECMESGGQKNWKGRKIGCYVGVFGEDWLDLHAKDPQHLGINHALVTGDFAISNRASYEFDLRGPSMTIRTACSSSLVALHEACQAIYTGECESAVVAGSSLISSPTMTEALWVQGVLSPTGSCRSFDAKADGYARGEAINAVFIKRLDEALRDGDPIRGVIRATALNFDGKTIGITNPNEDSQVALMQRAYNVAGISNPGDTGFVECHGTGTKVGDRIETAAVGRMFGSRGMYIGSVKPNIGHSEGASGLSSLIKAVLALEKEVIPPNINFEQPNPKIQWEKYGFRVPTEATSWPKDRLARVSVNCFGIGGMNAHVIVDAAKPYLDNASPPSQESLDESPQLLLFSAHQPDSLRERATQTLAYADAHPDRLPALAYTLAARRENLACRGFAVVDGRSASELSPVVRCKENQVVNFIFTGQGAQWPGMGVDLMKTYASVRDDFRAMDAALQRLHDAPSWTIQEELSRPPESSRVQQPDFAQPLCTALQIAIVNLLRQWGVRPAAVAGHSSGEIAAAYAAGALSLESAMAVAYHRGQVLRLGRPGAMASLGLSRTDAQAYVGDGVTIACENSPRNVTLSGDSHCIDAVVNRIKSEKPDCFVRRLRVDRAYHSHHMADVAGTYESLLAASITTDKPSIPFFSSVAVKQLKRAGQLGPAYWRSNLESPVLFSPAIQLLLHAAPANAIYLELGPHSALAGPLRDIFKSVTTTTTATYIASLVRHEPGAPAMLNCLGRLFQEGAAIDPKAATRGRAVLTDLPNYVWRHDTRYWSESRVMQAWRTRKFPHHELLGCRIMESDDLEPAWRNMLQLDNVPWIRDHRIHDDIVLPAAAYIGMAVEALRQLSDNDKNDDDGGRGMTLRHLDLAHALVLNESQSYEIITHMRPLRLTSKLDSSWFEFSVLSLNGNTWTKHSSGQIRLDRHGDICSPEFTAPMPRAVSTARWYRVMKNVGLNYGPSFQGLSDISADPGSNVATSTVANHRSEPGSYYLLHPTIIDLALQAFTLAISRGLARELTRLRIPTYLDQLYISPGERDMRLGVAADVTPGGHLRGSATIMARDRVVLDLRRGRFSPFEDEETSSNSAAPLPAAQLCWKADIDLVDPGNLIRPATPRGGHFVDQLERLSLIYALQLLGNVESLTEKAHNAPQLLAWLQKTKQKALDGQLENVRDASRLATLDQASLAVEIAALKSELTQTAAASVSEMLSRLSARSSALFSTPDPATIALEADKAMESLQELFGVQGDCSSYLNLLAHANPTMKILHICSGTTNSTVALLKELRTDNGDRAYERCVLTRKSEASLEHSKILLKDYDNVDYTVLDIGRDPTDQGFAAESFDLVVASYVLASVPSIRDALQNMRLLLNPGGRLLLQESSPESILLSFIQGFQNSRWMQIASDGFEAPDVSVSSLDAELREAGFTGNDCAVLDSTPPIGLTITSRASGFERSHEKVTILCNSSDGPGQALGDALQNLGFEVTFRTLEQAPSPGIEVISVLDLEYPFFHDITADRLSSFQEYLRKFSDARGMLWVTGHAQVGCKDPWYAVSVGVSRNIRSELSLAWATLELEPNTCDVESIAIVFEKFHNRVIGTRFDPDWEFAVADNTIMIPRFHWIDVSHDDCQSTDPSLPRKLGVGRSGQLSTIHWEEDECSVVPDGHVEIDPRAVGLNFKDILMAMGIVEGYCPGLGLECAGIVRKVGRNVHQIAPGDHVMLVSHGCFSTSVVADARGVMKMPKGLSFEEAAAMPCVYATAIHCLVNLGNLQEGQSVLIHSAAGGVGMAALSICKMIGAKIFATVGSQEKVDYLEKTLGLPREHIFHSRDASFYNDLMATTNGRGVDIVLNSLSGELLHVSWKCVAKFGKMFEIGKRDFVGRGQLSMDVFESNRSFYGIDISEMAFERPEMIKRAMDQFAQFFDQGLCTTDTPLKIYESTEVVEAFRCMQMGQHMGKIVIRMPSSGTDLAVRHRVSTSKFRGDGAYLLVGGMGGLGRSVSTWMAQNGAHHLVFLSRSAGNADRDGRFIDELQSQGCQVQTLRADVTDAQEVMEAIKRIAEPIRGVLLMTMVLRDGGILQLSHEDWIESISPKVKGALNLHNALVSAELDFFVLFSSISYVVGQIGQANYSSANAYLAAFTQFRHGLGLPASTLNVGVMDDVGYVVENQALLDQFRALNYYTLKERELLDSLTYAISHQYPSAVGKGALFVNSAELTIGLRSTLSLSDPANRSIWKRDLRMAMEHLRDGEAVSSGENEDLSQFMKRVKTCPTMLDESSNVDFLTEQIGERVYSLMSRDIEDLDVRMTLSGLGVDSLVAIEIRNWWRQTLGVSTSVLELMAAGSIAELGKMAAESIKKSCNSP